MLSFCLLFTPNFLIFIFFSGTMTSISSIIRRFMRLNHILGDNMRFVTKILTFFRLVS